MMPTSTTSRTGDTETKYIPGTSMLETIGLPDGGKVVNNYNSKEFVPGSVSIPGGKVNLTHDKKLNLNAVDISSGTVPNVFDAEISSRTDQGQVADLDTSGAAGGATTGWTYHAASGLPQAKSLDGVAGAYGFTYRDDGLPKTFTRKTGTGDVTQTFSYTDIPPIASTGHSFSDGSTPAVVLSEHDPMGRPREYSRDGYTYTIVRDPLGRLTSSGLARNDGGAAGSVPYGYYGNGEQGAGQRETGVADLYTYDSASRLSTIKSDPIKAEYTYEPESSSLVKSVKVTDADSGQTLLIRNVGWESDADRVESVSNTGYMTYDGFRYGYYDNGQVRTVTFNDGDYLEYTYDSRGQLQSSNRYNSDGSMYHGVRFAYKSDSITNVLEGGRENSHGKPEFKTDPTKLNDISVRTSDDELEIAGVADGDATVSVNDEVAARNADGSFLISMPVENQTAAAAVPIEILAVKFDEGANPDENCGGDQPDNVAGADIITSVTGTVFMPKSVDSPVYEGGGLGRLAEDSLNTYSWDAEDNLTAVESKLADNPVRIENRHDHGRRRMVKTVKENGIVQSTHYYIYDTTLLDGSHAPFGVLTGETVVKDGQTTEYKYIWGLDLNGKYQGLGGVGGLLAIIDITNGKKYIPIMDAMGTVHAVIDGDSDTKEVVARYAYDPYGRIISESGPMASVCPFRFQTKYYDPETGLYYFGLRWYDPATCKWLTRDPIGEAGGMNLYAFCDGDPVNGIDYLGLESAWYEDLWTAVKNPLTVSGAGWEGAKTFFPYIDTDGRVTLGGNGGAWDFVSDRITGLNTGSDIKAMKNFHDDNILPVTSFVPNLAVTIGYGIPSDIAWGYTVWKKDSMGRIVLYTHDPARGWQSQIISKSDFIRMPQATVFINGIQNPERNAGILGQSHTNTKTSQNPFVLLHNPSYGFIPDMVECVFGKLGQASNTSKQMAELLAMRALCNRNTELVMHSQGTLIGTNALSIMHDKYGIYNWSNLSTEYHGSAANIIWARYFTARVGGQFDKMINHSGDAVGIWVGNNAFDPYNRIRSLLKAPSLGFNVNEYPSGYLHS